MKGLVFGFVLAIIFSAVLGTHNEESVLPGKVEGGGGKQYKRSRSNDLDFDPPPAPKVQRVRAKDTVHPENGNVDDLLDAMRHSEWDSFKRTLDTLLRGSPEFLQERSCELMSVFGDADDQMIILVLEQLQHIDIPCHLSEPFFVSQTTFLHVAARLGKVSVMQYLLNRGADLEAMDLHSRTPLHLAVQYNQAEAAGKLLEQGARLESTDESVSVWRYLLQSKLPQMWRTFCKHDPHYLRDLLSSLITDGASESVKELLTHCPIGDMLNALGMAPIHEAARIGHKDETLHALLQLGVDVNQQSSEGDTAVHFALIEDDFPTMSSSNLEVLLKFNPDLTLRNVQGCTPLLFAFNCMLGDDITDPEVGAPDKWDDVVQLISNGADLREVNELSLAARTAILFSAIEYQYVGEEVSRLALHLLSEGVGVSSLQYQHAKAHHVASVARDARVLEILLEAGADPNEKTEFSGSTPIFFAAADSSAAAVNLLVKFEADVNLRNERGDTALITLLRSIDEREQFFFDLTGQERFLRDSTENRKQTMEALLSAGTDVNVQNNEGKSALIVALENDTVDEDDVKLLLVFGADIYMADNDGQSPMDINRSLVDQAIRMIRHKSALKV